jgi:CheY-like chemotaxis protein
MKKKPTIAIVDDDADDRDIIRDAFEVNEPGIEYRFMENGDRLMQYLESTSPDDLPDLILMDLNMPGKDGRQALKEIKSNQRLTIIPTIVFTTSSSARDRQNTYNLGANCFITKPDTFNKLVELTHCIVRLWLPAA